jgi:hypothetical protein
MNSATALVTSQATCRGTIERRPDHELCHCTDDVTGNLPRYDREATAPPKKWVREMCKARTVARKTGEVEGYPPPPFFSPSLSVLPALARVDANQTCCTPTLTLTLTLNLNLTAPTHPPPRAGSCGCEPNHV